MGGFIDRMLGRNDDNGKKGSSATAKDRLQFVLVHDRINLPPELMREMQAEILEVIKRYVPDIEEDSVAIAVEQTDRYNNKIVAEIPFTKKRAAPAEDRDGNDDLGAEDFIDAEIDTDETVPNNSLRDEAETSAIDEPSLTDDDTHQIGEIYVREREADEDDD